MMIAAAIQAPPLPPLYEALPGGGISFRLHRGQSLALKSTRRIVAVLAGAQSGKTLTGPWFLHREIGRRGPGDYLAVTATYDLFKLKMLPALREVFEHILRRGRYWSGDRMMELSDPEGHFLAKRAGDPMWGRIILRSAESEGGLESSTALAAWLDEAGQDHFTVEAWEAVLRRLALSQGRILITTTLYNFGWLKAEVYDRWAAGDPNIDVIQFDSRENPAFPPEEYERARATMPPWRFALQYQGRYSRPAGLIYDCFRDAPQPEGHLAKRFEIPPLWPRYLGLDFGGVNTAGVFLARDTVTHRLYAYREYHAGERTAAEHVRALLRGEPEVSKPKCVGGSRSEGQWRNEFGSAKLPVLAPDITDVEVGINRVYAAFKEDDLYVFDDLAGLLGELRSYSRVVDAAGHPTEAIEDKSRYHRLDGLRYIISYLRPAQGRRVATVGQNPLAGYRG